MGLFGGSFEDVDKAKVGQQLRVLSRWQIYKKNPCFLSLFENRELVKLSNKVFGKISGTEVLLR